jgi:23S rRNA pseudouridine2605 synthase
MPERLQKIIARAGIASRRKAEVLITEGRVSVNGVVIRRLGSKADLASDTVCVDGKAVQGTRERRYLALNKPKACITSTIDPEGRLTVMDLLGPHASKGLFPVGRLDYNTEGLLILRTTGTSRTTSCPPRTRFPRPTKSRSAGCLVRKRSKSCGTESSLVGV